MVSLAALWLPIMLAAVIVFFASFVMHMLLKYHEGDYKKLPGEEKVSAAIREASVTPGLYMFPHTTHAEMKSPETAEKFKRGPVGTLNVRPNGRTFSVPTGPRLNFSAVSGDFISACVVCGNIYSPGVTLASRIAALTFSSPGSFL